jgi:hypothetical protein
MANFAVGCLVAITLTGCLDEGKPRTTVSAANQLIGAAQREPAAATPPPAAPAPPADPSPAPSTRPPNQAPVLSGSPGTAAVETQLYGFQPVATDPDGDALSFSISNKPAWATFSAGSGLLSGIPPAGSKGSYPSIQISVSDGRSVTALPPFSITVAAAPVSNTPPRISGIPPTSVAAGSRYSFRPIATDPDNQTLEFSIRNLPAWAAFDTVTGELTGSPSAAQAGTYTSIVISVSDGEASAALAAFPITVSTTNIPPTISGTPPATAIAGQVYSFTPSAADEDGQKLTFSITGRPGWATFDPATGRLRGTPPSTRIGTTSTVVITVSDGDASSSLGPFTITVKSATPGTATLSWVAPTQNVDGTPVTNLAGYRIAYGQDSAALDLSLDIPNPVVTAATIEKLALGTWYFAVKAYTTAGVESDLSNVAQKTIN